MKNLKPVVLSSLVLSCFSTASFAGHFEANALATTKQLYAGGASYEFNKYAKLGLGVMSIGDVESSLTTSKDSFFGEYGQLELKAPVTKQMEVFGDAVYVTGKLDTTKKSVDKAIGAGGIKYQINNYNIFAGYTSESTGFAGVDYDLTKKVTLTLGASYNSDYKESQAILGVGYNFGSGMNSALSTSAKYMVQHEYKKAIEAQQQSSAGGNVGGSVIIFN